MNKIVKSEFYNLLGRKKIGVIEYNSPVTILTGHNGTGKSTVLGLLHSTVSILNNGEFLFSRSDWAHRLKFSDESSVSHVKLMVPPSKCSPDEIDSSWDLKSMYDEVHRVCGQGDSDDWLTIRRGDYKRSSESSHFGWLDIGGGEATRAWQTKSILYCDEVFYSSGLNDKAESVERLEELDVFSSSVNLDKTLFLLLAEFSSRTSNKEIDSDLFAVIDDLSVELSKRNNKTRSLRDKLERLNSLRRRARHDIFFSVATEFFSKTDRELTFDKQDFLAVRVYGQYELVRWFDLSKGEKTLLCLLLVVYLNDDSNCIFLLDEPDLSLHIRWQKILLPSLRKLAPNSQFIVSTHSPAMVGNTSEESIVNVGSILR